MVARIVLAALVSLCFAHATASAQSAQPADEHQDPPEPQGSINTGILLRAFGAVQWGTTEQRDKPNTFSLGQFALFATSALTDRISVLAEVVLEGGTNTRVVTDLERLQLTYRFDDHLQVTAGRYHTGIGYYNTAFHHGAYFETPLGRPRVFAFEDEGGVLPVHDVGLAVRGAVPRTRSTLYYTAEIGNGRTWEASGDAPTEAHEEVQDANSTKSVNFGLFLRPERLQGFEVGGTYYLDSIARATGGDVDHRIGVAFLAYRTPSTELMAEWLRLTHRIPEGGNQVTHAGYLQLAHTVYGVKPYYRYDRLSVAESTPFIGAIGSFTGHTIGVRVEAAQWVGLKAQYEHADHASQRGVDAVRTQLVFVF